MTQEAPQVTTGFVLDGRQLTRSAINMIRVAFGIGGLATLVIGVMMAFWPTKAASAMAWMLGVYWVIAGVVYIAVGLFAKGTKTAARILDIVLGVLMLFAGITVASNPSDSMQVLGIFLAFYIGVLWVIEGIVTLVQLGDAPSRMWALLSGGLSIVAGIVLFTSPWWGIQLLFLLTAIGLILLGVVQLIRAFTFGKDVAV